MLDSFMAMFFLAPFRCRNCRHRFFRFSSRIGNEIVIEAPIPVPRAIKPRPAPQRATTIDARPAPPKNDVAPAPPARKAPSMPTILVADSDLAIRKLLRRILERHGYTIRELANPDDLEPELSSSHVDLLIADLDSPRREAADAITALRAEYPGLKVILLSAYWSRETSQTSRAHGAAAVLPKPFHTDALLESVRTALAGEAHMARPSSF